MTSQILVVAPHPDDETLGCGGTILRHIALGDEVHWLTVTEMRTEYGFSSERIAERDQEIELVKAAFGVSSHRSLGFRPAGLDQVPMSELVASIGQVVKAVKANVIYGPFRGDVHSDHAAVFDAVSSATKWFRYPTVKKILCYEALSETDFCINPDSGGFRPNLYVNIERHLDEKIRIMSLFKHELQDFPFPRSSEAMISLARLRGAASGFRAAEAFMMLREIDG